MCVPVNKVELEVTRGGPPVCAPVNSGVAEMLSGAKQRVQQLKAALASQPTSSFLADEAPNEM